MTVYLEADRAFGHSGFVLYHRNKICFNASVWMIPGTFFDDWDN